MAKIIEELAERFDLPADAAAGLPRVTLTGDRRVLIENHRGLLEYTGELVEVGCGRLRVRVRGEGLVMRAMDAECLVVTGTVFSVELG